MSLSDVSVRSNSLFESKAFSLVELLAVMAIVVLIAGLTIPALTAIKGGSDLTGSAYRLQEALDQARSFAIARKSYVAVGIAERPTGSNPPGVVISTVATKDGTRNFNLANLQQVSRLSILENAKVVPGSVVDSARPADDLEDSSSAFPFPYPLNGASKYTFNRAIEFSPEGLAYLPSRTPALARGGVMICIQAANQSSKARNYAQVQVDALTGAASLDRP